MNEKLTGKQLFMKNKSAFEDITFEDAEPSTPQSGSQFEESKDEVDNDDNEEDFKYDRALFEGDDDLEEVDFD